MNIQDPKNGTTTANDSDDEIGEVCIANISPRERMRRLIGGMVPFALALAVLSWELWANVDRWWRLPLFLLFAMAASGFFQWRDKT